MKLKRYVSYLIAVILDEVVVRGQVYVHYLGGFCHVIVPVNFDTLEDNCRAFDGGLGFSRWQRVLADRER